MASPTKKMVAKTIIKVKDNQKSKQKVSTVHVPLQILQASLKLPVWFSTEDIL